MQRPRFFKNPLASFTPPTNNPMILFHNHPTSRPLFPSSNHFVLSSHNLSSSYTIIFYTDTTSYHHLSLTHPHPHHLSLTHSLTHPHHPTHQPTNPLTHTKTHPHPPPPPLSQMRYVLSANSPSLPSTIYDPINNAIPFKKKTHPRTLLVW